MFINDIFFLDEIFETEKAVSLHTNKKITNLSYWNPSEKYEQMMMKVLSPQSVDNLFKYIYTYNIPLTTRNNIIEKIIGRKTDNMMCLLLANSTLAIANIINFLKLNGYNRLFIFQPAYFSVEEVCKINGISVVRIPINKQFNYDTPISNIKKSDAIWFTSPIYSTNCILQENIIQLINELTNQEHMVILDESLNINGYETIRKLNINKNLIGIYSPHKSLFLNGIKFSAILSDKSYDDFLEQWIDVIGGALTGSCINAINHFLSPNFDNCNNYAQKWFKESKNTIKLLLKKYPYVQIDTNDMIGSYTTLSLPNIDLSEMTLIKKIIKKTSTSLIPGLLDGNHEGSFRINLSLEQYDIGTSLNSLLMFIYEEKY